APCSRLNPCSASFTSGRRIRIWCAASSPYFWTTLSPGTVSSAARTASSCTGASNCSTTMVPPEKSIPSGMPCRRSAYVRPRMISTDERISACQRHRMKSKFVLWRICMRSLSVPLDAEACGAALAEHQLEERTRHEDRGKHVRQQANREGRRKPPDGPGAELEQHGRRNQRRDVRVEDGPKHSIE